MLKFIITVLVTLTLSSASFAADQKTKAIIGGGVGGAIGAAVGSELGDRNGAILGSALGAAIGTAVATSESKPHSTSHIDAPVHVEVGIVSSSNHHPKGWHCPPGQAKKGRC